MFDPFESVNTSEASTIDDEMVIVSLPIVDKTIGVNEGLFMGLIIGALLMIYIGAD